MRIILLAPFVFVAHFLEEAPGFVPWFNAHVTPGITEPLFWSVNLTGLGITAAVVTIERAAPSRASAVIVVSWLSFLMLANGLFHIVAAAVDRAYIPGLVTAIILYLPYYSLIVRRLGRERRISPAAVAASATIGALPMLAHGFLIVFRGSRLF